MSRAPINSPMRPALGIMVTQTQALTQSGAILLPQFYAVQPPYVPNARNETGYLRAPIAFDSTREWAVGAALPTYLRHYYEGAPRP